MVYEKIPFTVDVEQLQKFYAAQVKPLPPMMSNTYWGGWSIMSPSGDYKDGWQSGHKCFSGSMGEAVWDVEKAHKLGFRPRMEHKVPTQLCTGYVLQVVQQIAQLGFNPRRARWSLLTAGGMSALHQDFLSDDCAVRLHIPIITNPGCVFVSRGEEEHIPADGSIYLVKVNCMHQVINRGREDRVHIIMDVWDSQWVSQHHRMPFKNTRSQSL